MHLDDAKLNALLDEELAPREREIARGHLGQCAACRGRLAAFEELRDGVLARLGALDDPTPATFAAAIAARARSFAPAPPRARLAWAAGLAAATLLAVGLAYAIPGSPLRAWVASV